MKVPYNTLIRMSITLLLITAGIQQVRAQELVIPQTLTRAKMWIKCNPNGSLEREQSMANDWELAYPGHFDNRNEASGGWDANAVYNGAVLGTENVCWMYRNGNYDDNEMFAVAASTLVKNYNLVNPAEPEEYMAGTIGSNKLKDGKRHMSYKLEGKVMGWSQPKYDDFVIIKCKLTNTDDVAFKDFYYARAMMMDGPYRPTSVSTGWDVEYKWESDVSPEIGFIFYDDTSLPPTAKAPVYTISPGDSTGNSGDPGNIGTAGSIDYKLYSPSLYAYSFIPSLITPNKNGERKVWRTITSTNSSAPPEENMPALVTELPNYATLTNIIKNNQQPEVSWKDANKTYKAGDKAGSLWERNPRYLYAIGPYDIAPGQSIEWTEILLCGAMDRNITIRGGLNATTQFVAKGLQNLKENWAAAKALIANNYALPAGEIPPPTPADAPRVGNANELKVVPGAAEKEGKTYSGVNISWKAVHEGYVDPQTKEADFAAYKIYRSDISVEGPWELMATVPLEQAKQNTQSGTTSYFLSAPVGVPYRYCVTSVDTKGNESGKTGYSYYAVSAEYLPTNNQSQIVVVPNPFRQVSGFKDQGENKRLAFINIPAKCTIRIYTVALELLRTIEHEGSGIDTWGSAKGKDYMLTDFAQNVMPGIYIYHVESHVPGHEGETSVGKFAVIK